jgi:hypothetical protein
LLGSFLLRITRSRKSKKFLRLSTNTREMRSALDDSMNRRS